MRCSSPEFFRFLAVGGINTLIGYGLYLLFNLVMDYRLAYTLSYLCGILIAFVLNSLLVFRQALRWKNLAIYPVVYLLQYGLGLLLVWICVSILYLPEAYAPLLVIPLAIPMTYAASRMILGKRTNAISKR
ncbi:MAG: GtrA family protein [Xanthomonadaceae bacterium]|nr:GtrA family protein [Xanthomonadaceae bacterium]